jgi:hypothetical protein
VIPPVWSQLRHHRCPVGLWGHRPIPPNRLVGLPFGPSWPCCISRDESDLTSKLDGRSTCKVEVKVKKLQTMSILKDPGDHSTTMATLQVPGGSGGDDNTVVRPPSTYKLIDATTCGISHFDVSRRCTRIQASWMRSVVCASASVSDRDGRAAPPPPRLVLCVGRSGHA